MKLSPFTNHVVEVIQQKINIPVIFRHITPEHGGSINEAFKLDTSAGFFFLKKNDAKLYPDMFKCELQGLSFIQNTQTLHTPEIIACGEFEAHQFLILKFTEKGIPGKNYWEDFGYGLAKMHRCTNPYFGFDNDNYIGSLHQINKKESSWSEFFIHHRLEPLVAMALNAKKLNHSHYDLFQNLFKKIGQLFPEENASLVHGDLWNGNCFANTDGHPVIFDPAVYFGHREMDIAMTRLFGGFHSKFYAAYNEVYPLENGWEERIRIANLYPLLVHVNLFGGSYIGEVESVLNHFK